MTLAQSSELDAVVKAWEEVFQREVAATDDFFADLEGDSLAALQVVTTLEAALGVMVPISTLFEHPTPADLAVAVRELIEEQE